MAAIGENVQNRIVKLVKQALFNHIDEIDRAFMESEKGIKLSIPISIKPGKREPLKITVGLSGVTGRISDSLEIETSENQDSILDKAKGDK